MWDITIMNICFVIVPLLKRERRKNIRDDQVD